MGQCYIDVNGTMKSIEHASKLFMKFVNGPMLNRCLLKQERVIMIAYNAEGN